MCGNGGANLVYLSLTYWMGFGVNPSNEKMVNCKWSPSNLAYNPIICGEQRDNHLKRDRLLRKTKPFRWFDRHSWFQINLQEKKIHGEVSRKISWWQAEMVQFTKGKTTKIQMSGVQYSHFKAVASKIWPIKFFSWSNFNKKKKTNFRHARAGTIFNKWLVNNGP